jgi:amyloid beta precursor protein binding protein 1
LFRLAVGRDALTIKGIAHFTILSAKNAQASDVATNFFLHPESLGEPIAVEAVK